MISRIIRGNFIWRHHAGHMYEPLTRCFPQQVRGRACESMDLLVVEDCPTSNVDETTSKRQTLAYNAVCAHRIPIPAAAAARYTLEYWVDWFWYATPSDASICFMINEMAFSCSKQEAVDFNHARSCFVPNHHRARTKQTKKTHPAI